MHRWRATLLALAVALALSGCLRFSADLTLDSDNTVSGRYVVAVKQGTGDTYGMSDRALAEELWGGYSKAQAFADVASGDYSKDGYVGVTVSFADEPLDTFAPTGTDWGVRRVGDEFVVSGPSSAVTQAAQRELPDSEVARELADAQFLVSVTFPGTVTQSNGSVEKRTVAWNLSMLHRNCPHAPVRSRRRIAHCRSPGSRSRSWWWAHWRTGLRDAGPAASTSPLMPTVAG